ncbi:hypothetical protein BURMUCF1_A0241 [Burkholderia multivorans ATCC BAA-247]|uniref:Uncharacterized protein n=1 Tax=Burkholderia multivorans CGD2 TaxID=513052 RepID=B9BRZ2_9BURK|nr:hypothetical protein BURMUCGD1_3813 [Burkholderia multivorans CGD1]EEE06563.1 hypothetical protein BURMUCGD2_4160 [Burkholderia multivorans CGD2]EEE12184.1 hypothetical protein BURMUCGD2M_4149 [Burkholderia multivorans CGD2M]EJO52150.1 hypothetical protein BURMUCF1_A0241 [Burkholderia multivorans ATCC BAA-247]EJO59041.1 hypothetical protein BURMUCF2_A0243 [Burkholderia multivorans CF2]
MSYCLSCRIVVRLRAAANCNQPLLFGYRRIVIARIAPTI